MMGITYEQAHLTPQIYRLNGMIEIKLMVCRYFVISTSVTHPLCIHSRIILVLITQKVLCVHISNVFESWTRNSKSFHIEPTTYLMTQCAAVRTWRSVIRQPPQNWTSRSRMMAAIHGHSFGSAGFPPITRPTSILSFSPQPAIPFKSDFSRIMDALWVRYGSRR